MLILNNIDFAEFLSYDYRENICVVKITEETYVRNSALVKYLHLLLSFVDNEVFGYKFDSVSPALVSLQNLWVRPDIIETRLLTKNPYVK